MAKVGRPLKFESVAELQKAIDDYFASCDPHAEEITEWVEARNSDGSLHKDANGLNYLIEVTHMVKTKQVPYTITGLALALGTTRETLIDYEEGKHDGKDEDAEDLEFSDTVKRAKIKVQNYAELALFSGAPAGPIFNLKNNHGWKDRTEQENLGEQKIIVETRKHNGRNKD